MSVPDDSDGVYSELSVSDEYEHDSDLETDAELFEFDDASDYPDLMDAIDVKEKHQEITLAATQRNLEDLDERQRFLQEFQAFFKQKGTENFSILHSLARDLYDKSDGKKRNDYKAYIPLLNLLLEHIPDLPTQVDAQQRTALHMVAEAHQSEVVKYLVDNVHSDPDWINKQRKDGETVLHICLRDGLPCSEHLIRKIATKGRDSANKILSIKGEDGDTPLHIAVQYGKCYGKQAELVQLLLETSDISLGMESDSRLSPIRHHQESQKTFKSLVSQAQGVLRKKPSPSPSSGYKTRGASMEPRLRPRPAASTNGSSGNKQLPVRPTNTQIRLLSNQQIEKIDLKIARKIYTLLLQQCLRTRPREDAIRILHGSIQRRQIDFDLVPLRKHKISADVLDRYGGHLAFEPVLQYVAIPKLEIEKLSTSKWEREPFWDSKGRKDYLAIFDWLYERKVNHIVRVIVADHDDRPHSDAVIVRALHNFGVDSLDWRRFDLSSHCILSAVADVRHLKLYCSGNNAILRSWSAPSGLVNLKNLQILEVELHLGWETLQATKEAAVTFENEIREIWQQAIEREGEDSTRYRGLDLTCYVQNQPRPRNVASNGEVEKKRDPQYEQRELWIDCMKSFGDFVLNYEVDDPQPAIKVALIDDGVDLSFDYLDQSIKGGHTCSVRDRELGFWNPFYHSANGHGTVMATLIRQMCPKVQLYVAKLNEIATQDKNQITASSAVEAINWARIMKVDIISMSWSIDEISDSDASMLQEAVNGAIKDNILLFCASDDQGNSRPEDVSSYPAKCDPLRIFRIGAATRSGHQGEWVRGADYILPGEKEQLIPSYEDPLSGREPREASSLATALASGLAALILYCAALKGETGFQLLKTQPKMDGAFKNMCKSQISGNQYPHVSEVFARYLPKGVVDDETEKKRVIEQVVAHLLRD